MHQFSHQVISKCYSDIPNKILTHATKKQIRKYLYNILKVNQSFYINIMEEISQGQFRMPIQRFDGMRVSMEIKQKHLHSKKRRVKTWTQEEDIMLLNLYSEYPKKWTLIASLMHDRNENQCLHRYRRITQLGSHRKIWSTEEDETVRKLMKKVGKNWKILSEMLGTKTGKQIRERFINKLDPKIKKEEWSDEEDRKIIALYSEIGRKWSEISKQLPGRPENKVKNRFYSYIQKNYDIKYRPIQQKINKIQVHAEEKIELQQKSSQCFFRQITNNIKSVNAESVKTQSKQIYNFPSINRFQDQIKIEDFSENQQNRYSRVILRSMMRVEEEEWPQKQKIDDFCPNQDLNNDFFFLSNS